MPKIRSLKADFFQNEDVSISLTVKILAAGLICCMADDEGRFKASPAGIKGLVFTHDRVSTSSISEALVLLDRVSFIQLFEQDGRKYGQILNWDRNQYIPSGRKSESHIPPAPPRPEIKPTPRRHTDDMQAYGRRHADAIHAPDTRSPRARERKGKDRIGVTPLPPEGGAENEQTRQAKWLVDWLEAKHRSEMTGYVITGKHRAALTAQALGIARMGFDDDVLTDEMEVGWNRSDPKDRPRTFNWWSAQLEERRGGIHKQRAPTTRGFEMTRVGDVLKEARA